LFFQKFFGMYHKKQLDSSAITIYQ